LQNFLYNSKYALYSSTSKSKLTAESKILRARPLLAYFPDNLSGSRKAIKPGVFNAFLSITFIIREIQFYRPKKLNGLSRCV